jgi:hypothetical protein
MANYRTKLCGRHALISVGISFEIWQFPQTTSLSGEIREIVKAMMKHHASGQTLTDHQVLFFDWNGSKGPERPEEVLELEWRRVFVGGVLSGCDQIQTHLGEILD